mmetsp:Transcript_29459/g.28604  ORF Transcript_29459/g.28604 Transcript_29459/m.28604 type:complete len:83 (+) Transcript_29459:987-1235(+)
MGLSLGETWSIDEFKKICTLETLSELNYLQCCINESLRFQPPVPIPCGKTLAQDMQLGKYTVKANDELNLNIVALHRNKEQW